MADLTKREKLAKASLYDIGYEYLRKNFRKFNERNKIKVAIAILSIFEKDDSKTKPELHTHFTVIKDGEGSNGQVDSEANSRIQIADES